MFIFWTDLVYLTISVSVAGWVGWTLHKNGRVFLMEVFQRNEELADSVNHLILVGFYLVSIGFVAVAIKISTARELQDASGVVELMSTKVGMVLLVLGITHFLNLFMFSRLRWRVRLVAPQGLENLARPAEAPEHPASADEPGLHDYYR